MRIVTIRMPHVHTASIGVFVRSGSAHESRLDNGISHFVEHMVFKGTLMRDARRINLDAERLGAEVNAHTDKDHTGYTMHGRPGDLPQLVDMLADLVRHPTFPAEELERERQVLLHECTEDEDDPLSTAFKLFDKACWGTHALAQSVIGPRRNIERFTRDALVDYLRRQYTGANVVVGAAGDIDVPAFEAAVTAAFGSMPAGSENLVAAPVYAGGVATKRLSGSSQAHLVLGFPLPGLVAGCPAGVLAAAVFGEGMSSPLMDRIREQRGLAYYTACSADVLDIAGQFVVEASTAPEQLDELLTETLKLLKTQAQRVEAEDLERAKAQLEVRRLRSHERPYRRLEDAVLDLYAIGRVRDSAEWCSTIAAVPAETVRAAFERLLAAGPTIALAGELPRAAGERVRSILAAS
ncbi:peptidase M16 [Rubrivivax gelatinosus]|nr:peptidase M16 [Rubrivivax gelatinosus]